MHLNRPIYLDNLSTTPVDPEVLNEMLPYFNEKFGNEGSRTHLYGWEARESVTIAREHIANLINCDIKEIHFTNGATESINIALKGVAYHNYKKNIITFTTEHKATIDVCSKLESDGYQIKYISVDKYGHINLDELKKNINKDTFLITILHANNEIGNIYPIEDIGNICNDNNIIFHVDAAQTFGKIPIDVKKMNIDLLSFSSHKIYGPKGVGGLYVNNKIKLIEPILHGGGQENNLRPGTLAVQNIVGFGKATEVSKKRLQKDTIKIKKLRDMLLVNLQEAIPDIKINGDLKNRLSGNLNITIPNIQNSSLMMSMRNIALSNGSACTSSTPEPSHVLRAIGLSKELANSSIRFGIGRFNTEEEIKYTIDIFKKTVNKLRAC